MSEGGDKSYEAPAIVYEGRIEARAGSPAAAAEQQDSGGGKPIDPNDSWLKPKHDPYEAMQSEAAADESVDYAVSARAQADPEYDANINAPYRNNGKK